MQTQQILEIEVRNVYGNATVYPVNDAAKLIASIAGTATLTHRTLALAERLGYTIQNKAADADAWKAAR